MDYLYIIFKAVVQGITEFLPVSSSGHLLVFGHFFEPREDSLLLIIVLHLGTLVAVFIAFRDIVFGMIKEFFLTIADIFTGKFKWSKMNDNRKMLFMTIIATSLLLPVYLFAKDYVTAPVKSGDIIFTGSAFIFTAILLFISDACVKGIKTGKNMKITDAVTIGLFQCVALFPGVSRSGSTITGGLLCGFSKQTAVAFSFMLSIPAILGGGLLEMREAFQGDIVLNYPELLIGFVVSAAVGFLAIKLVKIIAQKEKFKIFGIYTAILGMLCIAWGILENMDLVTFFNIN
ncbi:MAG: undecaprenyl-diphosphate phosphatase [Oscillospiraceae bacterium]|jgi:undecaprenyl-diphosphatase|nr:undecaprenyl-diphosphate phosphatase [Oscillospiraceae bacterium]